MPIEAAAPMRVATFIIFNREEIYMAQNIYKVTKRIYDALKEGRIIKVGDVEYS